MDYTLVCDIMMDLEGSIRPAIYLADALVKQGYNVSMISPIISNDVERRLRESGITPVNLGAKLISKNLGLSMLWLEAFGKEPKAHSVWDILRTLFSMISKGDVDANLPQYDGKLFEEDPALDGIVVKNEFLVS